MLASFQAELLVLRRWPTAWVIVLLGPFVTLLFDYAIQYVLYLTAKTGTFSDVSPDLLLPALLPGQFVIVVTSGFGLYGTATAVVLGPWWPEATGAGARSRRHWPSGPRGWQPSRGRGSPSSPRSPRAR